MRPSLALTVRCRDRESFQSWVERLAFRLGLSLAEALHVIGVADRPDFRAVPSGCFLDLEPVILAEVARTTRHAPQDLAAALLSSYRGRALPKDWRPGTGWVEWAHQAGSLLCPDCIADQSWRLAWKLPWSFACVEHECLLVATCPSCERMLGGNRTDRSCLPAFPGSRPRPGRCLNAKSNGDGSRYKNRCDYDLSIIPALSANDALLGAQRVVNEALATGRGQLFGRDVPSLEFLSALRSGLALWSYAGLPEDLHLPHPEMAEVISQHVDRRTEAEEERRNLRQAAGSRWAGPAMRHWGVVPRDPLFVAAFVPVALRTILGPLDGDRPDLDLLAERVKSRRPNQTEAGFRQFHTPEPLVKDLLRRSTRLVRFAIRNDPPEAPPGLESRHIPTLFWNGLYQDQLRLLFPEDVRDHIGRRFCSIAAHRLLFGGTWNDAVRATTSPIGGLSISYSRYTKLLRDNGTEEQFKEVLSRVIGTVAEDREGLVDYRERRCHRRPTSDPFSPVHF